MQIHDIIKERWSPVAFSSKTIDDRVLDSLFEAARWAPSSFNAQPWKFMVGRKGEETYDLLFSLLKDMNKRWAQTAPVLVLSMAEVVPPGRTSENRFAFHDTGMAVGNLLAQATHVGLHVHQMGGYDVEGARSVLHLPMNIEPAAMMAIGYKGDPSVLPDEVAAREEKPRERRGLNEFVYRKKF